MTVAIDRGRSVDFDTRAAARRAEADALQAADTACDAYRSTLAEALRGSVSPDRVVAVVRGGPGDALASAVADLGSTAFAAARAAHLAIEAASMEEARRAGELAALAATAARSGAAALAAQHRADAAEKTIALAHRAAMLAHLAADALAAYGEARGSHSLLGSTDHPQVAFPSSWRERIEELSQRVGRLHRNPPTDPAALRLLAAAESACSGAGHALRTYQRAGRGGGVSRAICRATRIAALAASYAGTAALEMLEAGDRPVGP